MKLNNKYREVLENILTNFPGGLGQYPEIYKQVIDVLKEPLRNCDVDTPQEQIKRWEKFCQAHHEDWKPSKSLTTIQRCDCPCHEGNSCNYFIWSQMSYDGVVK